MDQRLRGQHRGMSSDRPDHDIGRAAHDLIESKLRGDYVHGPSRISESKETAMAKQVEIRVMGGTPHFGKGSTIRAAVKDAAERATNDLSKMKAGDVTTITRLKDSF